MTDTDILSGGVSHFTINFWVPNMVTMLDLGATKWVLCREEKREGRSFFKPEFLQEERYPGKKSMLGEYIGVGGKTTYRLFNNFVVNRAFFPQSSSSLKLNSPGLSYFLVLIALLANVASSLVAMATALGSTTIPYGQAMNGLMLPCLPCGDCWEVVCWAAVIFQRGFELSRRQNQGAQWPCFPNVPGCGNLQEFVGYGGDGDRGSLR